jgi:hypothetical protein
VDFSLGVNAGVDRFESEGCPVAFVADKQAIVFCLL